LRRETYKFPFMVRRYTRANREAAARRPIGWCERWWEVDSAARIAWITMAGVVTEEDLLDAHEQVAADRRFDAGFALILDLRRARSLPFTWAAAQRLAKGIPVSARAPQAIVASTVLSAAFAHAYAAMCARLTGMQRIRVCRSLREAHTWVLVSARLDPHAHN
jgi:hypothetical protein